MEGSAVLFSYSIITLAQANGYRYRCKVGVVQPCPALPSPVVEQEGTNIVGYEAVITSHLRNLSK